MDDNVCYKKFKEIIKNPTKCFYWRNWIENQLISYKQYEIEYLLQYYRIKYEIAEREDEPKVMSVFVPVLSLCAAIVPVMISILISSINSFLTAFEKAGESLESEKYLNMVADTLMVSMQSSLKVVLIMFVAILIVIEGGHIWDVFRQKHIAQKRVYYLEMVKVLQDIFEKRQKSKITENDSSL